MSRARSRDLTALYAARPLQVVGTYFAIYVAAAALSLPGAAILTLLAGAVFGLGWGTLIVSFASSIGATLALLVSRYLLRDVRQARFGDAAGRDRQAGIEREGAVLPLHVAAGAGYFRSSSSIC